MNRLRVSPMVPSWVERMTSDCWYRISGNHPDLGLPPTPRGTRYLRDTDPAYDRSLNPTQNYKETLRRWLGRRPYAPWQGQCGFPAITEAWNGAVLASGFGPSGSMIVFGGGHDDYFGSSVHAFDLATRQWSRISNGYVSGTRREYGAGAVYPCSVYPDGSPLPPHTYGYVQYDSIGNDFLLLKGQTELGAHVKSVAIPHMFNLNSLTWRHGPKHSSAILGSGGWTAWDSARRILWGHSGASGNAFIGFSPDGDNGDGTFGSWTPLSPKKVHTADHYAMAFDPVRDILGVIVSTDNAFYAIDPSTRNREFVLLYSTGDQPRISAYAALEYAPNLDRFVYYSANDGPQIYSIATRAGSRWSDLTNRAWIWNRLINDANKLDPISDAQAISSYDTNKAHTFGRFRLAAYGSVDVAILVRHTDTPVYAMRIN